MANPFDEFDAQATANPFDEFDEGKRDAEMEAQIHREMAMPEAEYASYIREKMKAGEPYRPQPTKFNLLSDQTADVLGVFDEMAGAGQWLRKAVTSGGDFKEAGKAYSDAADRIRAERRVARQMNGIIPEIVGGFGTTGVSTAVPAVARTFLGNVGRSAATGGATGAVAGFAQGEDGAYNRLKSAITAGGIGAAVTPAVANVALPLAARGVGVAKDAIRYGNNAVRSYRNPEQVAIENVADRMVASGLNPATARGAISPPPSPQLAGRNTPAGQPFNSADMADIISRSLKGETAQSIGQAYGISPGTVTRYVNAYKADNPTPLNLIDIAKEVQGEGASGPLWRLGRAANSLSGDDSADAAQALISRQETQGGRVGGIARQATGGKDYEATLQAGLKKLQSEADQNYKAFYAEPELAITELSDLMDDPVFRQANLNAQQQARVKVMRRNQEAIAAGRQPEPVPAVDESNEVFSPEMLDLIQRQLRIKSEGHVSDPNAAAHARDLREVFLDRIEQHYPTFRGIRRSYAQGQGEFGSEGALQAGRDLTNRLGERTDEALRDFDKMTAAQKELFRLGFARKIQDDAANPQFGNAVANKYRNQATEEIVKRVWSGNKALEDQGKALLRNLKREAITTKTKNDVLAGSRTAELQGDSERLMQGAKAAADVATLNFSGILQNLSTRLTTQLGQRGAAETMKILTETSPDKLLPLLNRLEQAAQGSAQRKQLVTQLRALRSQSSPALGVPVGELAASPTAEPQKQRSLR